MSAEAILQNMLNNTDNKFDKSNGSFVYDVEKAVAIELQNLEVKNESFIDKIDVDKLTEEELERFVYQRTAVSRKEATYATKAVTIVASAPTTLVSGSLVAADDIFYEVVNTTNVVTGSNGVVVRCTQSGSVGNVPVGAINAFPVTLANIVSVTNTEPFDNGYDEETDESLRSRYYAHLQNVGKAGNPDHFREWAQEVAGVGKVKVTPRWRGPLTVRVAILDVNSNFATTELINNVYNHIMSQLSIGPDVSVVTATRLNIDISANFVLIDGYVWEDVKQDITDSLNQYFNEIAFEDDTQYVSYARIGGVILNVEGIEDYSNLLVNGGTVNVQIGEIEKAAIRNIVNNGNA